MIRVIQFRWLDEEEWKTFALADDRPNDAQIADAIACRNGNTRPECEYRITEVEGSSVLRRPLHTIAEELYYAKHKRFPSYA